MEPRRELDNLINEAMAAIHAPLAHVLARAFERGVERGIELGIERGAERERQRVISAFPKFLDELQQPARLPEGSFAIATATKPVRRPRRDKKGLRSGSMNETIFRVIQDMSPLPPGGVDTEAVLTHSKRTGHQYDAVQVRTAMKLLARTGYLRRLERGRYALNEEAPPTLSGGASEAAGERTSDQGLPGTEQTQFPDRDPG